MWVKTENSEAIIPPSLEKSGDKYIVRRGFHLVAATEEKPEHYEYEEFQMTKEQYEVYQNFDTMINEQSDALIELAELISEVL